MDYIVKGKGKERISKFDLNEDFAIEDTNDDDHLNQTSKVETSFQELSNAEVNALQFDSNDEAYNFYLLYAKQKGFSVRKTTIQRNKDDDGRVRLQRFVSSREGQRAKQKDEFFQPKREARGESRVNCDAHMRIKFERKIEKYVVTSFMDDHSHELTPPEHVMFLRSQRAINNLDMADARSMHQVGISTSKIMDVMAQKHEGYENCGYLQKDLSNAIDSDYREEMMNGDAEGALAYFAAKEDSDPAYFYKYECDGENRLDKLFWADGKSRDDYAIFGDVLAFDTTYRTNIYNKPFIMLVGINNHYQTIMYGCALLPNELESTFRWILEVFLEAMKGKRPSAVITDGDKAMRAAILSVFPQAHHRLCKWHIQKNVTSNIHLKGFLLEFTRLMEDPCTPEEFEQRWSMLLEKYELANNKWLPRLHNTRKLWAEAFLKGNFFAYMTTTGRCEGFNGYFNHYLNKKLRIFKFVQSFDRALKKIRHKETARIYEDDSTRPVLSTKLLEIERHASEVYTRRIFMKVREEIQSTIQVIDLEKSMDHEGSVLYYMSMYNNPESTWVVRFRQSEMTMNCSCLFYESVGLPCKHMFHVMKVRRLTEISQSLIVHRWTKNASSISSLNFVHLDTQGAKHDAFTSLCNKMAFFPSHMTNGWDVATKEMEKLTSQMQDLYMKNKQEKSNDDNFLKNKFGVRDPEFVATKGNPGSKKFKKIKRCGLCRGPGHTRNNCPTYEEVIGEKSTPYETDDYTACINSNVVQNETEEFQFQPHGMMPSQESVPSTECNLNPFARINQESGSTLSQRWGQSDIATLRNSYSGK